jgi:biopolymer transport protein TolR
MAFTPGSKHGQMADINMTPLIDVMLVLLIIFMVAAPMLTTGVDVNLPKAVTGRNLDSDALVVTLDKAGHIEFEKQTLVLGAFQKAIRTSASASRTRPVMVRADHALPYGQVIEVVDAIRQAGFTQVGFVTQGAPPASPVEAKP